MAIKNNIKRFMPFLIPLALLPEYFFDYLGYLKYSGVLGVKRGDEKLIGRIIAEYHVVEKGLTMPETRLGFGRANVLLLIENCLVYAKKFNFNNNQFLHGVAVVLEYRTFHQKNKFELDKSLQQKINQLEAIVNEASACEQIITTNSAYFQFSNASFEQFSASRKSVRNYSPEDVSLDQIRNAIDLARNTPSSCNRQGARVYVFTNPEQIEQILRIQGGNRGFGHLANKLIVITEELGISHGVYERHQVYVDGGMFAMNVLYALHKNQIAACPLNCNFSIQKDRTLRKICEIPKSEVFVMMISCGQAPENFKIAVSTRYPVEKIMIVR